MAAEDGAVEAGVGNTYPRIRIRSGGAEGESQAAGLCSRLDVAGNGGWCCVRGPVQQQQQQQSRAEAVTG